MKLLQVVIGGIVSGYDCLPVKVEALNGIRFKKMKNITGGFVDKQAKLATFVLTLLYLWEGCWSLKSHC